MTALPLEPHTEAEEARLARFEGAAPAEESAVEKVARAMWAASFKQLLQEIGEPGSGSDRFHWAGAPDVTKRWYRAVAAAAIEAMKGGSRAEEALARVEAACDARERQHKNMGQPLFDGSPAPCFVLTAAVRAAITVPVAQAGEGR